MLQQLHRYRWFVLGAGTLFVVALSAWLVPRWLAPGPGLAEDIYSRVRTGMTKDEAVAALRSDDLHIDTVYSEGTTTDGQPVRGVPWLGEVFDNLPPADEIEHCVLTVMDYEGGEVEVVLGRGGAVVETNLTPGVFEDRASRIGRVVEGAFVDVCSVSWWLQQPRKLLRSAWRNWPYHAPRAVVLLLALMWAFGFGRRPLMGDIAVEPSAP
jgi:hypothetical protein